MEHLVVMKKTPSENMAVVSVRLPLMRTFSAIYKLCKRCFNVPIMLTLLLLSYVSPRSSRKIVIGGWFGGLYADNPKFFLSYILANTSFNVIWIGEQKISKFLPKNPRVTFVQKGSASALFHLLTAKMMFCCHMTQWDFTNLPVFPRALCRVRIANAWHGIPIKHMGQNIPGAEQTLKQAFLSRIGKVINKRNEYLSVSSDDMAHIISSGWPKSFSEQRVLKFGTPRNDFLLMNKKNIELQNSLRKKYMQLLKIPEGKKIILYLPTWRTTKGVVRTFYAMTREEKFALNNVLDKHNAVLIEKHHYMTYVNNMPTVASDGNLHVILPDDVINIDIQELLLVADVLISDYSGAFIDFGLLERPIIHYAYDYVFYKEQDTGLAYKLEDVAGGVIVYDHMSLMSALDDALENPVFKPGPRYHDLVKYETGSSCANILKFLKGDVQVDV